MAPSMDLSFSRFRSDEWRNILIGTLIAFFCTVEHHVISIGEWAYMNQIDSASTSRFFGFATALGKLAGVTFAFVFAFWAQRSGRMKGAIITGRVITLIACVLYLCIEFMPDHRRFGLAFCYFLFGVGFSTSPLLRSYIAEMSSAENRSSAYSLTSAAMIMSIIVGPGVQLIFRNVAYPGYELFPNIRLHIYSAPIWLALFTNILVIVITQFLFTDVSREEQEEIARESVTLADIRAQLKQIRELPVSWILVGVVLVQKCISMLTYASMAVISGPLMSAIFAFRGDQIVVVMSISQCIVGILALIFALLFIFCNVGKRISTQWLFLFSKTIFVVGYILIYPWPAYSKPLQKYDNLTRAGCNPDEYTWCDTELGAPFMVFTVIMILVMGIAIPTSTLSLDTIYSKILGNIDQNLMQAVFACAENVMMVVGPVYATQIFAAAGMSTLCITNALVFLVAVLLWIAFWKRIRPYR